VNVTFFLPGPSIGWAQRLKLIERVERAVELFEVALADCKNVQGLIVVRACAQQFPRQVGRSLDATVLQQLAPAEKKGRALRLAR
jgi:hypothetical protein